MRISCCNCFMFIPWEKSWPKFSPDMPQVANNKKNGTVGSRQAGEDSPLAEFIVSLLVIVSQFYLELSVFTQKHADSDTCCSLSFYMTEPFHNIYYVHTIFTICSPKTRLKLSSDFCMKYAKVLLLKNQDSKDAVIHATKPATLSSQRTLYEKTSG